MSPITRADAATPALPTGTLTFLFSDIEGSTRLWEAAPDAMQVALARHDVILRQGIKTHGGHVFKTAGDAFYAAFTTPWLALEAALAIQQTLHLEPWPPQAPIRVRMALHSGAAELREGDYFGPPLNQVARLLSTGHGGQTLVSSVACELCNDRLPTGAALKSLGEYILKDLARRQTIYQLEHPSLPATFPALRTLLAPLDTTMPSIAVLPFANRSRDKQDEYFSDGLADELLNVLAKIRSLRVAARSSAFTFKGKGATVAEMGRALNVATVLEGTVRKAGNRIRISVQLVKVADGYHLWSETYDRTLDDIFAVQDDIAQAVVKELRSALMGKAVDAKAATEVTAQMAAAVRGRATDPEVHRLYLHARYLIGRLTRDDTAKGISYLKRALERDAAFALAWAELGEAYAAEANSGWAPVVEGYRRAREAVAHALSLAPDLAEAHAELGWIRMSHDWDWRGAEASYRRALELAPGDATVLRRAAMLALNLGRVDEAIGLFRRAVEQDPLSAAAYANFGDAIGAAGSLGEAELEYRKALELAPHRAVTQAYLALNLWAQGRGEAALAEALEAADEFWQVYALAIIHYGAGRRSEADAALRDLIAKYAQSAAYQIAEVHAARGEKDHAFDWLERAYIQRDLGLSQMKTRPLLHSLRGDSRWAAFLHKMGLAD